MIEAPDLHQSRKYKVLWSTEEEALLYNAFDKKNFKEDENIYKDDPLSCIFDIFKKCLGK